MNGKTVVKIFGTALGVGLFGLLIASVTFAWFTWSSTSNTTIGATTGCFTINYTKGADISGGTLNPVAAYNNGLSTSVTLSRNASCVEGTLTLYLNTTAADATLLSSGALKYAVYNGSTKVSSGSGVISAKGDLTIATLSTIPTTDTTYTVYVWLDGAVAGNDVAGKSYAGYIHASATQNH